MPTTQPPLLSKTRDINNKDFELALCISERFCDVFQYTDPWAKYLNKKDRGVERS